MHDIRNQIPLTDQTNPAKFPQYEFREYPKMVLDDEGVPVRDKAKNYVIAHSADEYNSLKAKHFKPVTASVQVSGVSALMESDEVKRLREEIAALKAAPEAEPKKRGRPAKSALPANLD